jgi:hypothetical protein
MRSQILITKRNPLQQEPWKAQTDSGLKFEEQNPSLQLQGYAIECVQLRSGQSIIKKSIVYMVDFH